MVSVYSHIFLHLLCSNTRQFANSATALANNSYYGVSIGPVHIIGLNSYAPYGDDSMQAAWFKQHMATVNANRAATPWVIVNWHTAAYHTYNTHFRVREQRAFAWLFFVRRVLIRYVLFVYSPYAGGRCVLGNLGASYEGCWRGHRELPSPLSVPISPTSNILT